MDLNSSGKDEEVVHTGSIAGKPPKGEASALPPENDLAYAKVAVTEVLARGGKDASQPWENPSSGARGTITPIATSYVHEGALCRDFLASYVNAGTESWMQGEACRAGKGKWEVRRLKPWRQT